MNTKDESKVSDSECKSQQKHRPLLWWRAWQFFSPRWIMAAEGKLQLDANLYNKLQKEGFDTIELHTWEPDDTAGRRIAQANNLIRKALNTDVINSPDNVRRVMEQLAGDGVWADLRKLAEAWMNGQQLDRKVQALPTPPEPAVTRPSQPAAASQTFKYPNQIKKEQQQKMLKWLQSQKPLTPAVQDIVSFIGATRSLTLYLDETWSGETSKRCSAEGVIAGLLCLGEKRTIAGLPQQKTHTYEKPEKARDALQAILSCPECMPLLLPLRLPLDDEPASRYYDMLLQQAICLLCGWLLPPAETPLQLAVFIEAIEPAHAAGENKTEYFRGVLAADPARYGHIELTTVQWRSKSFGYIPCADLLGYVTLEHTRFNKALGLWVDFKQLPGYVPFSLALVPRLERLAHLEHAANMQDVIDFALEAGSSVFGKLMLTDIAGRMGARPDLQQRLLESLEALYQDKVRDLQGLRRAFGAVRRLLPDMPAAEHGRIRLLRYLLELQDANHDGDPQRIRATAGAYTAERNTLKQVDRELCAYTDLNLAVHYADRFEFGQAEVTVSDWTRDALFAALSLSMQGRMFSASGQYCAMQGRVQEAEQFFVKALRCFDQAPLTDAERVREQEQTGIYRAFNALDGGLPNTLELLKGLLGNLTEAAAELASSTAVARQYLHHLLLRALLQRGDLKEARQMYLNSPSHWPDGPPQHPWPSIHGLQGLLLWRDGPQTQVAAEVAFRQFSLSMDLAGFAGHGPTVWLIGGLWGTVASCCFESTFFSTKAGELLEQARVLPGATAAVETLEAVLKTPAVEKIDDALAVLPFNYR